MLAFPAMIAGAAEKAGMKVPEDIEEYDKSEYPHWFVFCQLQLGVPMPHASAHWDNAKVIANIPDDRIMTSTAEDIYALGFEVGFPLP